MVQWKPVSNDLPCFSEGYTFKQLNGYQSAKQWKCIGMIVSFLTCLCSSADKRVHDFSMDIR